MPSPLGGIWEAASHDVDTELTTAVEVDQYYLSSWDITLVCIILFIGLSNVAFITLRYRLKLPDAGHMSWEQIKWIRTSLLRLI